MATNAAGAYDLGNIHGFVAEGVLDVGSIPAEGDGIRLMWYPGKAAFRVGSALSSRWDAANVGDYSVAMGLNASASGRAAVATGLATTASGESSTATGERTTADGDFSTAMGRLASTNGHRGAFVYGDASTSPFGALNTISATADDQFSVRASGGVRFFTHPQLNAGVTLAAGGSSWNSVSDRARKEEFRSLDAEDLLDRIRRIPVTRWRYIAEEDRSVRHIGPMAQDWAAAFPELGGDGLTINQGDFDGVNLVGIQALEIRTRALREENAALIARVRALEVENAALRERLDRIEAALEPRSP